jgi:nicotinamide-nucleotide amidase
LRSGKLCEMASDDIELARLALRVGLHLRKSGSVVSTAESCTGGWISKALTDIPGSSEWFSDGFVTYSNPSKIRRLGVLRGVLKRDGAVSKSTAKAMACGALRRARTNLSVAVTGIAGPGGAVKGKPVGTVWFAWATRQGATIRVKTLRKRFRGDRDSVRRKTVSVALAGILRL